MKLSPKLLTSAILNLILVKLMSLSTYRVIPSAELGQFSPESKVHRVHNLQAKLGFEDFLKALELISVKVYDQTDEDTALESLINNHIAKVMPSNGNALDMADSKLSHVKKLMDLLKDESIVDIIARLKKSLHKYYLLYTSEDMTMNFEQFSRFCRDFGIFPSILSKAKLMNLFYNLAILHPLIFQNSSQASPKINKNIENNDIIDENLFTEALTLCALEINDESHHPISKVVEVKIDRKFLFRWLIYWKE